MNNSGNCPWGGVLARFYGPGVRVLNSFLSGWCGIRPSKNCPGGWSGLELTDTLFIYVSLKKVISEIVPVWLKNQDQCVDMGEGGLCVEWIIRGELIHGVTHV